MSPLNFRQFTVMFRVQMNDKEAYRIVYILLNVIMRRTR